MLRPVLAVFVVVCVLASPCCRQAWAGSHGDGAGAASLSASDANSGPSYRIHANSHLRTTITNWGLIGNAQISSLIDSSTLGSADTLPAPSLETPPHSQIDYLFSAGLWVGGVAGGDTLVSTGASEWPPTYELHPGADGALQFGDLLGDEELTAHYTDTITDPAIVRADQVDGTHRSLPVRIRQTTRLVDDSAYDKGIVLEIVVTNIGTQIIKGLWLGWYVDADILHPSHPNSWLGDLSGHHTAVVTIDGHDVQVAAAWSADNDGDPDSASGFDARSPTGVLGMMYLGGRPLLGDESFNWWNTGFSRAYDWGPSQAASDTNIYGGYGRAIGDRMKYRRMANREIDYDQVDAAIDKSAEGWIPSTTATIAKDFADGYDTRFLLTHGPVDLIPGDSVVAVWALVVAPSFHTDPSHFQTTFDAAAPQPYLAGLNFASLDTALARMKVLWDSRFHDATIGAPTGFAIAGWDDSTAEIRWHPRGTQRLSGYGLFRSLDSGSFFDPPIATLAPGDSSYSDSGLHREHTYFYTIRSIDSLGRLGASSPVIAVLPDRPLTPRLLSAHRGNRTITIDWQPATEPDVVSHRVDRRTGGSTWDQIGETAALSSYTDATADNAVVYEYRIQSVSALGTGSYPSAPLQGLAFAFDGLPLVIDETFSGPTSLTDKDSVAAVWRHLVWPLGAAYRDADPVTTLPFGLAVYDPHPATIVVTDGRYAMRPETPSQLALYQYAGGIAILTGRDLFNAAAITEGTIRFGPGDWPYDNIGITAAYYPRVLLSHPTRPNAEFIGAKSRVSPLPDLSVDPARTGWGLNPALPLPGDAIPFVGYFEVDTSKAEVIYTYQSRDGAASPSDGKAVGVISKVAGVHTAILAFPLSYMIETDAAETVARLLARLGWTREFPGDLTGDGSVQIDDVVMLIDYLYREGSITNPNNGDVNGDCRLNLVDVVTIINYIFRGGLALVNGCVAP